MTILITVVLAVVMAALIIYPFFGKVEQMPVVKQSVSAKAKQPKSRKPAGKTTGAIDDEIEKRVRELRNKSLVCSECGGKNREGSKFCTYCGAKLNE